MPFGYHGCYLRVNASTGESDRVPLRENELRRFLGGVGLGTWILARETPRGVAPLGGDAALVVALSPLVGSPLTTSAKFAVLAISPLTGRLCDALSSSRFAIAAKRAGMDALVVRGARDVPSLLFIDGQGGSGGPARITWKPAGDLWTLPARRAEALIRERHGTDWQVLAIGPAGEALIPFATLSHDGRHAGRGGLGAVLGSKRIKAVAVRGDRRAELADPSRVVALARELSARSFGPATAKYRELGTVANLLVFNRLHALPTRNFGSGHFEAAEKLTEEELGPARKIARSSCAACTIGCEHIYAVSGGDGDGGGDGSGVRLEYESLYALGPLCGVDDPGAVLRAASLCDELGVDTITTGGTIALLMDCAERGWLKEDRLPSGRRLRFGDGEAVSEAIEAAVAGEGLGAWIALGSRRAAERIGGEAPGRAMHVKGLELPGYDPRRLPTMALGFAVGTRGADHNRSGGYEADFSSASVRERTATSIAAAAIETEDKAALIDSLILCKFLRGTLVDLHEESAAMLSAVTGWDVSADELRELARRIVTLRRCLNEREGWSREEDTLPAALLEDGREIADHSLTAARLDSLIAEYYRLRGWSEMGRVPETLRLALDLVEGLDPCAP